MKNLGKELFYLDLEIKDDGSMPDSIDACIIMYKALDDKAVTTKGYVVERKARKRELVPLRGSLDVDELSNYHFPFHINSKLNLYDGLKKHEMRVLDPMHFHLNKYSNLLKDEIIDVEYESETCKLRVVFAKNLPKLFETLINNYSFKTLRKINNA